MYVWCLPIYVPFFLWTHRYHIYYMYNTWTLYDFPQLYVPRCTSLTPEGVIRAVTALTEGSNCLTSVKISGIYNLNQQHLQVLESSLPKGQDRKPRFYHKYDYSSFRSLDEDTCPIDVEMCPKCQEVRLVFDCARKSCGDRCRGCLHCIPRCEGRGKSITNTDDELGKTICMDYLCLDCWLSRPKCNHCNKPFCPRHADEESKLMSGSSGFVCQHCQHGSFKYMWFTVIRGRKVNLTNRPFNWV